MKHVAQFAQQLTGADRVWPKDIKTVSKTWLKRRGPNNTTDWQLRVTFTAPDGKSYSVQTATVTNDSKNPRCEKVFTFNLRDQLMKLLNGQHHDLYEIESGKLWQLPSPGSC
jgi:hypothetical protein